MREAGGEVIVGRPQLLVPCATSLVPAAIGGCGDEVDIQVTAGPLDCETLTRIGSSGRCWDRSATERCDDRMSYASPVVYALL